MAYIKPRVNAARAMEILRAERMWYPMASDLELPEVPSEYRPSVRAALRFLGKVPIQAKDGSWLIAQAIADLANDPRVEYVEGLVSVESGNKVSPGAWNLVDGQIVSLHSEVLNRVRLAIHHGTQTWLYEPLKIYSVAEIHAARKAGHPTCSNHEWRQTVVRKPEYNILEKVFQVPLQRMLERKQTDHQIIDVDWK